MSIENLKKHVGIIKNIGTKVAVVFRKVPNEDDQCVIIDLLSLPDSYQDIVYEILNSKEARDVNDLSLVLNGRTFHDGSNCLQRLHVGGFMRKVPVSTILMEPLPGRHVELSMINASIDNTLKDDKNVPVDAALPELTDKLDPVQVAEVLLAQAEALEEEAAKKREEAYVLDPSLRPTLGRPSYDAIRREQVRLERKEKRREIDKAKKAKAKDLALEAAAIERLEAKSMPTEAPQQ